jgi:hypothetical protein
MLIVFLVLNWLIMPIGATSRTTTKKTLFIHLVGKLPKTIEVFEIGFGVG